jgi:hypothetical protein
MAEENDPFGYRTAAAPPDLRDTVDYLDKRVSSHRRRFFVVAVLLGVLSVMDVACTSMLLRIAQQVDGLAACRVMTSAEEAAEQAALEERHRLTRQQDQELCERACPANPNRADTFVSATCAWGASGLRSCSCYCARATDVVWGESRVMREAAESR